MRAAAWHISVALLIAELPLASQQRPVKVYTAAEGLGHNRVKRVIADSKGFLWLCTREGLTRFDGLHFVNFGTDGGAPFFSVNDLLELPTGDYWIATNGQGVVRFAANGGLRPVNQASLKDRFTPYLMSEAPATNRVNALYRDRAGTVWIGTDGGLFRLIERNGLFEIHPASIGSPSHPDRQMQVIAITGDTEGGIFVGTRFGLVRILPDGRRIHYAIQPTSGVERVTGLLLDHTSVLWIGYENGLFVWRPAAASEIKSGPPGTIAEDSTLSRAWRSEPARAFPGLPKRSGEARFFAPAAGGGTPVVALAEFSDKRIWFCQHGGLYEFNGSDVHPIATDLPFPDVVSMQEDAAGNAWLASLSSGVSKLEGRGLAIYGRAEGIGPIPYGAFADRAGEIVVPSPPNKLSVSAGGRFSTVALKLSPDAAIPGIGSVLQDHTGEWWVGTTGGVYRFPRTARAADLAWPFAVGRVHAGAGSCR
jgi:ligand-binding sensor domain-containing protein